MTAPVLRKLDLIKQHRTEGNSRNSGLLNHWHFTLLEVGLGWACFYRLLPLWHLIALVLPGGFMRGSGERAAAVRSHQRGSGWRGANGSMLCEKGGEQGSGGSGGETGPLEELPAVHPAEPPHPGRTGRQQRRQTHRRPSLHHGVWNLFILKCDGTSALT